MFALSLVIRKPTLYETKEPKSLQWHYITVQCFIGNIVFEADYHSRRINPKKKKKMVTRSPYLTCNPEKAMEHFLNMFLILVTRIQEHLTNEAHLLCNLYVEIQFCEIL